MIAPRHPERFNEVASLIESAGLTILAEAAYDRQRCSNKVILARQHR